MHILGIGGHMRRIYNPMQYEFLHDLQPINVLITIGAIGLGFTQLLFAANFFGTLIAGKKAERNPWKSNTLEWEAPTPTPHGNFPGPLPTVYRGPYEYSSPLVEEDYLPQARRLDGQVASAH
jgi:cytochrome c oxidase subunit 1